MYQKRICYVCGRKLHIDLDLLLIKKKKKTTKNTNNKM